MPELFLSGFRSCCGSRPDFFTSKTNYARPPADSRARERKKLILRMSNFAILVMLVIAPNTYECFEYAVYEFSCLFYSVMNSLGRSVSSDGVSEKDLLSRAYFKRSHKSSITYKKDRRHGVTNVYTKTPVILRTTKVMFFHIVKSRIRLLFPPPSMHIYSEVRNKQLLG